MPHPCRVLAVGAAVLLALAAAEGSHAPRGLSRSVFASGSAVWPAGFVARPADPADPADPPYVTKVPGGTATIGARGLSVSSAAATFNVRYAGSVDATCIPVGSTTGAWVSTFLGNDPSRWRRGAPVYETVRCEELYPDIDLEYSHTAAGELKTTWHVGPGADTSSIRWAYSPGATVGLVDGDLWIDVELDSAGERTPFGAWREERPAAWQVLPQGRREVQSRFRRFADGSFGFDLASYDDRYPLEIDPTLVFLTLLASTARAQVRIEVGTGSAPGRAWSPPPDRSARQPLPTRRKAFRRSPPPRRCRSPPFRRRAASGR